MEDDTTVPPEARLPGERWRPVVGYEGQYEVSDRGRVWSVPRTDRRGLDHGGKLLTQSEDRYGYLRVSLTTASKSRMTTVHTLVLRAFAGEPEYGQLARHGAAGRLVNHWPENLQWGTHQENMLDKRRDGTASNLGAGVARLADDQIARARRRYKRGESASRIARELGVETSAILNAIMGCTYRHVPEPVPSERRTKAASQPAGEALTIAKLTAEIVRDARKRCAAGESVASIAREVGVNPTTLLRAVQGVTWKHVTDDENEVRPAC